MPELVQDRLVVEGLIPDFDLHLGQGRHLRADFDAGIPLPALIELQTFPLIRPGCVRVPRRSVPEMEGHGHIVHRLAAERCGHAFLRRHLLNHATALFDLAGNFPLDRLPKRAGF